MKLFQGIRRAFGMGRITALETYQGFQKKKTTKKEPRTEIVSTPSSLQQFLDGFVQAFDSGLITTTGKSILEEKEGLEVFAEMMRDPQIKSCIGVKKYAIISNRWFLLPPKGEQENTKARDILDFVEWNLGELLGQTGIGLDDILSAFEYGRADSEIVWDVVKSGKWAGKYYIKELKQKNIGYIAYEMDQYDNIKTFKVTDKQGNVQTVPRDKMVHYAWSPEFENPYGIPDLGACYIWYWLKKAMYKFSTVYGEKFAAPIPVFTLEKIITAADRALLETAAKDFQITNSFILPKGVTLDLKGNDNSGGDYFIKMMQFCDSQIAHAILFQSLTTNENMKTGTHAQAKVHQDTLWYLLAKIQDDLERIVEQQIIQRMIEVNFTGDEHLKPNFGFEVIDADRFKVIAEAVQTLCTPPTGKANSIVDLREDWLRGRLGIPARDLDQFPFEEEISPREKFNAETEIAKQKAAAPATSGKPDPAKKPGQAPPAKPAKKAAEIEV
jgi:phage gp29-like protein